MLELPKRDGKNNYVYKDNCLVKEIVAMDKYVKEKRKPARNATEVIKWGDVPDIILCCKALNRPIICITSTSNSVSEKLATTYLPGDTQLGV